MRPRTITALALALVAGMAAAGEGPETGIFAEPVKLAADGEFIDVQVGHADPFVCDWNGDGLPDLLVGQFGGGRLLVFPNRGTAKEPKLGAAETFQAGGEAGTVPSG